MHRVLSIPEILLHIFSLLPRSSNASNARVCQAWSDPALDVVWHDILNVTKMFDSLAPTTVNAQSNDVVGTYFLEVKHNIQSNLSQRTSYVHRT